MRSLMLLLVFGCGNHGGGGQPDAGIAMVTAKMLNGASPGAAPHFTGLLPAGVPSDGAWNVTPNQVHVPLVSLQFTSTTSMFGTKAMLSNCSADFDVTKPGLAQSSECQFTVDAGTYDTIDFEFGAMYQVLIDDTVNNIYSDPSAPSLLSTTRPPGGPQLISVALQTDSVFRLATPFTISAATDAGAQPTLSILVDGLQFFEVSANGGALTIGFSGNKRDPALIAAVGTPAAIGYYVNPAIGTAYSYNAGGALQNMLSDISVLSAGTQPTAAFVDGGAGPGAVGCANGGQSGIFRVGKNYLGADANGVVGWAGFADANETMFSMEAAMPQVTTLGGSTTYKCLDTTTDPMPAGGSFASGAPVIANPTYTTAMTLVAN